MTGLSIHGEAETAACTPLSDACRTTVSSPSGGSGRFPSTPCVAGAVPVTTLSQLASEVVGSSASSAHDSQSPSSASQSGLLPAAKAGARIFSPTSRPIPEMTTRNTAIGGGSTAPPLSVALLASITSAAAASPKSGSCVETSRRKSTTTEAAVRTSRSATSGTDELRASPPPSCAFCFGPRKRMSFSSSPTVSGRPTCSVDPSNGFASSDSSLSSARTISGRPRRRSRVERRRPSVKAIARSTISATMRTVMSSAASVTRAPAGYATLPTSRKMAMAMYSGSRTNCADATAANRGLAPCHARSTAKQ